MKNQIKNIIAAAKGIKRRCKNGLGHSYAAISNKKFVLALLLALPLADFANSTTSPSANLDKLDNKASRSTQLYVEPEFNFRTYQSILLDLSVVNTQSMPIHQALLSISAIPTEVNELSDERLVKKSLLGSVRTDGFGRVYQTLEISNSVSKVLIELNAQGVNNKVIIDLANTDHISHVFISE